MKIEALEKVFFLGIGGIGMSAVAQYLHHNGVTVCGYDRVQSTVTDALEELGITIYYQDTSDYIDTSLDLVIYTPAIPQSHNAWARITALELPALKRSEALQHILAQKKVVAIAGTHGKTSTAAILSHLMHVHQKEVTAFVGGIMTNYDSNFIYGSSEWAIVEADEFDRSFLRLYPQIAIINAIDADHLDIYGTKESLVQGFRDFTMQIQAGGSLWVKEGIEEFWGNMQWQRALEDHAVSIYSFGTVPGADLSALFDFVQGHETKFMLCAKEQHMSKSLRLPMLGQHNVLNAVAASAAAMELGLSLAEIAEAMQSFKGIKRRFEIIHQDENRVVVNDYAHHPEEIKAAIQTARKAFPNKRITVLFQPHLYSRTKDFYKEFAISLSDADQVRMIPLYPAREKPIEGVSSRMIIDQIRCKDKKLLTRQEVITCIAEDKIEVLLVLGAGDVENLIPQLLSKLK